MQLTKTITRVGTPVQIAVVVSAVAVMAAIAIITAPIASNFAISTATTVTCTDTDGGKNYPVKGTVKAVSASSNFTMSDSCKSATVLNELFCDPIRKYANAVTQTCAGGCSNGACLKASTSTVATPTVSFLSAHALVTSNDDAPDLGEFTINMRITNNSSSTDVWFDRGQAILDGTPMPAGFYSTVFSIFANNQKLSYSSSSNMGWLVPQGSSDNDSLHAALIPKGSSRDFQLYVSVVPMMDGLYNVDLTSLRWDTDGDNNTRYVISSSSLDQFQTDPVYLSSR